MTRDLEASVLDRLRNEARTRGKDFQVVLARFGVERMQTLADTEPPTDVLAFSSELITRIFAEHTPGDLRARCATVSMNAYLERKYENVQAELRKLYQTNRSRWAVRGADVILTVNSYEAHGLRAEIPDWLLKEGSKAGNIVMDRNELEAFLGIRVRRRWLGVG